MIKPGRTALRLLPSVLMALMVLPAYAELRLWTSPDSRQIRGELVCADNDGVTIRRKDGRVFTIAPTQLSEEDRAYLSQLEEQGKAEEAAREKAVLLAGPLTYGLSGGHEDWPADRRKRIVEAMEAAVMYFNQYAEFEKHVTANNSPGTPTADANYDGWINWGGSINRRVALHEIAHTLGIGTHPNWQKNIEEGKWTGKYAARQLREFDGPDAVLHADRMHFWPYGLNYDKESNPEADLRFIKMVEAFRKDLGID